MIGIVLTGHGGFPTGMYESVQLISGEIEQIAIIPFEENQDKLRNELEQAIEKVDTGSGVVCFTDLAGGTPFNISSQIATGKENIRVIGGTNTPMLLSGLFQRGLNLDDFTENALKDGKEGIKQFELKIKEAIADVDGI